MSFQKSTLYPTREMVIEKYNLNEDEQVYLADELLQVEIIALDIKKALI